MKRIMKFSFFLLLGLFLFSSCSSNDDVQPQEFLVNPPSWLFGSWYQYDDEGVESTPMFRFSEHKIDLMNENFISLEDYLDIQRQENPNSTINITESENNSSTYTVKVILNNQEYLEYVFNKLTDTTISQCSYGDCKNLLKQ